MTQISIPTPCSEDWNSMLPEGQGRHCLSCAKTVVDFTVMNDDEVRGYLLNNTGSKLCGRFRKTQLQQIQLQLPENIFNIPMPLWKVFLLASAVAFSSLLFSCSSPAIQAAGKFIIEQKAAPKEIIVGELVAAPHDTIPIVPVKEPLQPEIMGAIAIPVEDTIKENQRHLKGEITIGKLVDRKDSINCKKPGN